MYGRFRAITEDGLAVLADRPPAVSARLREVHAAYTFFEREYPALIARYLRERAAERAGRARARRPPPTGRSRLTPAARRERTT